MDFCTQGCASIADFGRILQAAQQSVTDSQPAKSISDETSVPEQLGGLFRFIHGPSKDDFDAATRAANQQLQLVLFVAGVF